MSIPAKPIDRGHVLNSEDAMSVTVDSSLELILFANHTIQLDALKRQLAKVTAHAAQLQGRNALLNKLMTMIGQVTDDKNGTIHFGKLQGLDEILAKARDMGLELPEMKGDMSRDRGYQLLGNLKNMMEAHQLELNMRANDMNHVQMQLTEIYQLLRMGFNTLDRDKKKKTDAMAGR